ncbi:hypothetical protein ACFQ1S_20645, partial [Kibdelosporangium lantanae]
MTVVGGGHGQVQVGRRVLERELRLHVPTALAHLVGDSEQVGRLRGQGEQGGGGVAEDPQAQVVDADPEVADRDQGS